MNVSRFFTPFSCALNHCFCLTVCLDMSKKLQYYCKLLLFYYSVVQKGISESTTRWTLRQKGYSSRIPHRFPLLWAQKRKMRLQLAYYHQKWKIKNWKNISWYDESRFLPEHADEWVRILHKQHESCLVSTVQAVAGGEMVRGMFSRFSLNSKRSSRLWVMGVPIPNWPLSAIAKQFAIVPYGHA